MDIKRKRNRTETLKISDCPACGGDVWASDCGYSSFNPGFAKCRGECKREWKLGYVDSEWHAGKIWNAKVAETKRQLRIIAHLKQRYRSPVMPSRDFSQEEFEATVLEYLQKLELDAIGGGTK